MAKNIQMNYNESGGYEVLHPENTDSNVVIDNTLNALKGYPDNSTLNYWLFQESGLEGKSIYTVTVTYNGEPVVGETITGLQPMGGTGTNIETDSNGQVKGIGNQSNQNINITLGSYIDMNNGRVVLPDGDELQKSYTWEISGLYKTPVFDDLYESSKTIRIFNTAVDICVVGGGGAGASVDDSSAIWNGGATGGGSGYIQIANNKLIKQKNVGIVVGTGATSRGAAGGMSYVTIGSERIQANGGFGGGVGEINRYTTTQTVSVSGGKGQFQGGDVLLEKGKNIDFKQLQRVIERPFTMPRYRLSVLTPDERVDYVIPKSDIVLIFL